MNGRHYGMDWLRVGAFALLIFYHIGMVYVPWDFHIDAAPAQDWVQYPMLMLNPWRLALLFVVSGFASRNLLAKLGTPGAFAASRARRLLIPLLFCIVVVVPPQPWIELMAKHGYTHGFWSFWTGDYFRFGTLEGIVLPTWNHLWFVVYLLAYTMIVAGLCGLSPRLGRLAQAAFDRAFGGWGLILIPAAWFMAVRMLLFPTFGETHALFDDWAAHALYLACFLFGMGLARSAPAWEAIRRLRTHAAAIAVASGAAFLIIDPFAPVELTRLARSAFAWSAIVALIAIADRYWNRDHPHRAMLTEAVFPFYIIHQTIIIVAFWWLQPAGLPQAAEFALLVAATAGGCWLFYRLGREIPGFRVLIGLEGFWPRPAPRPIGAAAPAIGR